MLKNVFYSPTDAQVNCLKKNFKIYVKIEHHTPLNVQCWFITYFPRLLRPKVVYIQGVTGGTDQTSGECSLGQTIPI